MKLTDSTHICDKPQPERINSNRYIYHTFRWRSHWLEMECDRFSLAKQGIALEQAIQADRLRCEKHLGNVMSHRGGRRRTTWKNHWNHGQTQNIRVPISLAPTILKYAKAIDCGMLIPLSQEEYQQIILLAIDQFVEKRKAEFHPNQHSRTGSTTSRRWDELRRFRSAVASAGAVDHAASSEILNKFTHEDYRINLTKNE